MSGICRHLSSGILLQILPKALIQRKVPLTILSGISHMRDIHINVLLNLQLCITHIFSFSWIFPEFHISCSIVQGVHQVELTASATLTAINIWRKDLLYNYKLSVSCLQKHTYWCGNRAFDLVVACRLVGVFILWRLRHVFEPCNMMLDLSLAMWGWIWVLQG